MPELVSFWDGVEGVMLSSDDTVASLSALIEQNPDLSIIARDPKGAIVSAVLGTFDGRRGYLRHLVVDPEYREHGLGTAVVRAAEIAMKARGISGIAILVQKDNPGGRAFWENAGYAIADQVDPMFKRL
jgi:ribosomal protein S18 acetylase RimI-like enzyme